MKADIKEKWLQALRSGEYKQARGALRIEDTGFCCLGVLCDVAAQEGAGTWIAPRGNDNRYDFESGISRQSGFLPSKVCDWADINFGSHLLDRLVAMNDSGKASFLEIADTIEKEL